MPGRYKPPPTGSLPREGKKLHRRVYEESRDRGYDKDSSAAIAWTAVKNAGYYKGRDGKWHAPGNPHRGRKKMAKKKTKKSRKRKGMSMTKGAPMGRALSTGRAAMVPMTAGQRRRKRREKKLLVTGKHVIAV